ncbi:MAG TPA: hypothetical protein VMM13_08625, partial [Euzebya sp.]|nr:hypothetical protein [Euzebya sp.]
MSNEELSASQRAALAQQAAAAARRAAARHAAARRAEQDARRRETPARRPPALVPKAGVAYRTGASTTVDPSRAIAPAATTAPAAARRPVPPRVAAATTPAATPPQPRAAVVRSPRPAPPAATIAPLPAEEARPSALDVQQAVTESAGTTVPDVEAGTTVPDVEVGPGSADAGPSPVVARAGGSTSDQGSLLDEGERVGVLTGQPTALPPLPLPPSVVVRTVAPKAYADGLLLPGPPRHHDGAAAPAAQAPAADEDQPAAMSLATVDIDVRRALHDVDTDEHAEQPPAADSHAPTVDEADGHAAGVSDRPAEVEPDDRRVVEDAADVVGAEPAPETEAGSPWAPSTELADAVAQPEIPDAVGHEDVAASGAEAQTVELTAGVGPVATDRPWVRAYPPGVPDTYRYPLVPVTRFLDDAAQDFPDIPAVRFLGTDLSFRQLSEQVDRLATAILDLGLTAGD